MSSNLTTHRLTKVSVMEQRFFMSTWTINDDFIKAQYYLSRGELCWLNTGQLPALHLYYLTGYSQEYILSPDTPEADKDCHL